MKLSLPLFLLSAITSPNLAASVSTGLRGGNDERALEGTVTGTYLLGDIQYEQGSGATGPEEVDAIELSDGQILELTNTGLPPGQFKKQFKSGADSIELPAGTTIKNGKADLKGKPPHAKGNGNPFDRNLKGEGTPEQERNLAELRRNLAVVGNRSVLAVRVIAANDSTTSNESTISDAVFGTSGDPVNLKSQYTACSHGALNFVEAPARTGITNGVTTVTVSTATSEGDGVMRNAITSALNSQFGVSSPNQLANHVMYCLPPGTMSGIAYAYINSWNSVYSDAWCNYVSGQMHEIGHNIGLAHSNENGQTYTDQSGMMGYSYGSSNTPEMCFNSAKMWQLGWFSSAARIEVASGAGATHIINGQGGTVEPGVIKINTSSATDYYVSFNRKFGYNIGTVEAGNQVTVHSQGNEGNGYSESSLLCKLNQGGTCTVGGTDTITVVSINTSGAGFAEVQINSGGPVTPPPTPAPTTPAPTNLPTTPAPTAPPTPAPSPSPTVSAAPTKAPTPPPTNAPTPQPTPFPTSQPTNCNLAAVGESCVDGSNCCSGLCSGGKKQNRVCLAGSNPPPSPTTPPPPSPTPEPPTGPTPQCDLTGAACGNCCNGCQTKGRKAGTCK